MEHHEQKQNLKNTVPPVSELHMLLDQLSDQEFIVSIPIVEEGENADKHSETI